MIRREIVESLVFILLVVIYATLRGPISRRVVLIVPISLLALGFVGYVLFSGQESLRSLGLSSAGLSRTAIYAGLIAVPTCIGFAFYGVAVGRRIAVPTFALSLILYPLWGVIQQILFQSILHTRLMKAGLGLWSIVIVALAYASVHPTPKLLLILSLCWGIAASWIFSVERNVWPLGLAHGVVGAFFYYCVLGKDALRDILNTLE